MIFLFLRSVSATIIPALAVPVSLIGTCAAMYAFGFSINNMTLLALTLSVGFVVDDAIVMLENIVRHIEGGMRPFEAALKGAREIGFTIISITFSLIAVFIPVLLMGGMVGRVFREFAVTIAVAIIISGFVSLTLTPMLCARVLRATTRRGREAEHRAARVRGDVQRAGCAAMSWSLDKVLAYKFVMLAGDVRHARRHRGLYVYIPKGFFPTEDTGFIAGTTEGAPDISFQAMVERQRRIAEIVREDPAVDYVNSTVGVGGPNPTTNYGRMFIALKPRRTSATDVRGRDPAPAADRQRGHRHGGVFPAGAEHQHRRPHHQERISVHAADRATPTRSTQSRPRCATRSPRSSGLRDVNTDLYITQSADDGRDRPREGRRSTASPSIRSARSCSTPSARARWRRSSPPPTTTR